MWPVVVLVLACGGDPELRQQRAALDEWDRGVQAMERGEHDLAREHFGRARESRPEDPLLGAWEAHAAAESGDLDEAIELLDQVLDDAPHFAEARYNRAAYHSRQGRPDQAGADLERAIADGAARSREAVRDEDFAPWLDHRAFDFLPDDWLSVAVDGPEGTVFLGSEFTLRLRVVGAGDDVVQVRAEPLLAPLELVGVVEEEVPSTQGLVRDLSWTFRVLGAAELSLGPFEVAVGGHPVRVGAYPVSTAAPEGREPPEPRSIAFTTPAGLRGDREPPAAWWVGDDLAVLAEPADVVVAGSPPVRFAYRTAGQPRWMVSLYPTYSGDALRVSRSGEVLIDALPARE